LELVAQAGLIIKRDGGDGYYDRFRGRLMFPICDEQGRVVAFSGRVLSGDEKTAKYVNSPETPIFTKGRLIFGLDKAKRAILDKQVAVVCEGQLDMIACYGAGVQNTVAPQGTAFTAEQARILKRYTKEVVLCFDSDNAGVKAAVRVLDDLLNSGLAIRVASIPQPHDPDSFIKEFGPQAFNDLIQNAVGFFDFYLDLLCKQNDIHTDRGQKEVARAMSVALAKTGDTILFEKYARIASGRLGIGTLNALQSFKALAAADPSLRARQDDDEASTQHAEEVAQEWMPPAEEELLFLALTEEQELDWLSQYLDLNWLTNKTVHRILELRLMRDGDGNWPSVTKINDELGDDVAAQAALSKAATDPRRILDAKKQMTGAVLQLRAGYIDRQIRALIAEIGQSQSDPAVQAQLLSRRKSLYAMRTAPLLPISDASEF
jgi:DNA primase